MIFSDFFLPILYQNTLSTLISDYKLLNLIARTYICMYILGNNQITRARTLNTCLWRSFDSLAEQANPNNKTRSKNEDALLSYSLSLSLSFSFSYYYAI